MADSKRDMNLGGLGRLNAGFADIKSSIVDVSNVMANQLLPLLERGGTAAQRIAAGLNSKTGGAFQTNKVAQNASDQTSATNAAQTTAQVGQQDANKVAYVPTTALGAKVSNVIGGMTPNQVGVAAMGATYAFDAGKAITSALPTTPQYVQQDFLTNRARFYGFGNKDTTSTFIDANGNRVGFKMGGDSNGVSSANNNVTNLQNTLNMRGTMAPGDLLDSAKALATAQAYGLAGAPNVNKLLIGAAAMSNITPGVGINRSVQATAAMQQASNVNMMLQMGIQIRGQDGTMKSVPQVVDEVWNKLNQGKRGGSAITEDDILISMEPGNAIDSMLNMYFGNDPVLRKQVADGLIVKARSGGRPLESLSKKELQKMGVSTAAVNSMSERNARSSRVLQQIAPGQAAGFTASNQIAADLSTIANALTPIARVIGTVDAFRGNMSGIGGGAFKTIATGGAALIGTLLGGPVGGMIGAGLSSLFFKADGGPVEENQPYIVGEKGPELFMPPMRPTEENKPRVIGEKGPELFVPDKDGVIIPNHVYKNMFKAGGGDIDGRTPYIVGEKGPELFIPSGDGRSMSANALGGSPFRKGGGPVKKGGDTVKSLYNFLISQGFSQGGAEGVIGNLQWESGLNPTIKGDYNKATGQYTSYGIAQWHDSRWTNLNKFAKSKGLEPGTIEAQQQFLMHELTTGYSSLLKKLKDPDISKFDAAKLFMVKFERPKDQSDEAALKRANAYGKPVKLPTGGGSPQLPPTSSSSSSTLTKTSFKDLFTTEKEGTFGSLFKNDLVASRPTQNTYNYGGVNITITGASDPVKIKDALKQFFNDPNSQIGKS